MLRGAEIECRFEFRRPAGNGAQRILERRDAARDSLRLAHADQNLLQPIFILLAVLRAAEFRIAKKPNGSDVFTAK